MDEIQLISGFGEVKTERYGAIFLSVVQEYCKGHKLNSLIHLKAPKRQRGRAKDDTKELSLKLYKEGKTVEEIANERSLNPDTIKGHLAFYIPKGIVRVEELTPQEKMPAIIRAVKIHGPSALGMIKRELGNNYSYGEIQAVINYLVMKREEKA